MKQEVEDFLNKHFVGSLSSSMNNIPDIAIIFFVYIDWRICFKSRTTSKHSLNIKSNNTVAFSCYSHSSNYSDKYGIQIHGQVSRIRDEIFMKDTVSLYEEKFPWSGKKLPEIKILCSDDINSTFYQLEIWSFKIVDEWPHGNNTMTEYLKVT